MRSVTKSAGVLATVFAAALLLPHHTVAKEIPVDLAIETRAVSSDIPFIKCEVCTHVARAAVKSANSVSESDLTEVRLFDVVDDLCNPRSAHGRWTKSTDLVERLGKLRLIPQEGEQDCHRECRTLIMACHAVLDSVETELAEHLYAARKVGNVTEAEIDKWLCARGGMSSACSKRTPPLPRDRPKGPEFKPKDQKQADLGNLMESMSNMNGGAGLAPSVMSRDDMLNVMDKERNDDGDDDDDDQPSKPDVAVEEDATAHQAAEEQDEL